MKSESFIVTVDNDNTPHLLDEMELSKYSFKAEVDIDGSKQIVDDMFKQGQQILNPKYNPWDLVQLLDLYTYHASCVEAVAVDSSGINYDLKPLENVEPVEAEKERFKAFIAHCGIFDLKMQYNTTEEMWFANWDTLLNNRALKSGKVLSFCRKDTC